MKNIAKTAPALALALISSACSTAKYGYDLQSGVADTSFNVRPFEVKQLPFVTALKITERDKPLIIYIEGDGRAYVTPTLPSTNPTPKKPVAWYLAKQDPNPNVIYMGRPCQYNQNDSCRDRGWWTLKRFDSKVVTAYGHMIDQLKTREDQRIELVGYSGGAVIAMELAARRNDVASIRTVAGNLSPMRVNKYHRVSTQKSAVEPLNHSSILKTIPQIHFTGANDYIIPPYLTEQFISQLSSKCVNTRTVAANHHNGWAKAWPDLLRLKPSC